MTELIAVEGVVQRLAEKGPVGHGTPYDRAVVVDVEGTDVHVPVTGVRAAAFETHGDVPEVVDFDRVFAAGTELHAETWLGDGSLVEIERDSPDDDWVLYHREERSEYGLDPIWERPGSARADVELLIEQGLSAAEAVDFWMVRMGNWAADDWATERNLSERAVRQSLRRAEETLQRRENERERSR